MELSDPKIIGELTSALEGRQHSLHTVHGLHALTNTLHPHTDRRKRCTCGVCTMCVDNARWETIFNAKFADPDYYKSRPVRSGSSLDWMRPAARHNTPHTVEP